MQKFKIGQEFNKGTISKIVYDYDDDGKIKKITVKYVKYVEYDANDLEKEIPSRVG